MVTSRSGHSGKLGKKRQQRAHVETDQQLINSEASNGVEMVWRRKKQGWAGSLSPEPILYLDNAVK